MIRHSGKFQRKGVQFRPLNVAVFHNGRLERFEQIDDPREKLCQFFNQDTNNQRDGYTAFPVSSFDTKERPGAKWQVIIVGGGRPRCYLTGVPCRVALDWVIAFNAEIKQRGITTVQAYACSCSGDTTIEKAPSGEHAAKKRKGGAV